MYRGSGGSANFSSLKFFASAPADGFSQYWTLFQYPCFRYQFCYARFDCTRKRPQNNIKMCIVFARQVENENERWVLGERFIYSPRRRYVKLCERVARWVLSPTVA